MRVQKNIAMVASALMLASCATMPKDPEYYVDPSDPMCKEMTDGQKRNPLLDACRRVYDRLTTPKFQEQDSQLQIEPITPVEDMKYKTMQELLHNQYNRE